MKTVFFASLSEWVGLSLYLGLSWGVAFSVFQVIRRYGLAYLTPLFGGGLAYSLGAVLEYLRWWDVIPGVIHAHEIWHIMVLAGALLHWRFVWKVAGNDGRDEEQEGSRRSRWNRDETHTPLREDSLPDLSVL